MCSGPLVGVTIQKQSNGPGAGCQVIPANRSAFGRRGRARAIEDEYAPDAADNVGMTGAGQGLYHVIPFVVGYLGQTYLDEFVGINGAFQFGEDAVGDAVGADYDDRLEGMRLSTQVLSLFGVQHGILVSLIGPLWCSGRVYVCGGRGSKSGGLLWPEVNPARSG
ncbi:protein of unknown function [Acidithiobacillus ferrivorans]|uniref:Uncharacterized protein n=1 Tax=Acidithiobacillus ferrivorans TaxID=160808 RepID=A0ABY1MU88_9PROT|nr:protein of unknown function [Acidithiobacillus ferrivorans]